MNKKSKLFNLQQMKKQLGLIELKNSKSLQQNHQRTQNKHKHYEKDYFSQMIPPSFKKQKSQQLKIQNKQFTIDEEGYSKQRKVYNNKIKNNQEKNRQCSTIDESSGNFTDRITQLVKMRQQHQKIINSLIYKKKPSIQTSKISTLNQQQKSSQLNSHNKNIQLQNKYLKIIQQFKISTSKKQEPSTERNIHKSNHNSNIREIQNIKNQPSSFSVYENLHKKQHNKDFLRQQLFNNEYNNSIQLNSRDFRQILNRNQIYKDIKYSQHYLIKNNIKKQQNQEQKQDKNQQHQTKVKKLQKQNKINSKIELLEQKKYKQSLQIQKQNKNHWDQDFRNDHQFKQEQYNSNPVEQQQQLVPATEQPQFQLQNHVNLIASLSQFQQLTKRNEQYINDVNFQIKNQLHYSILQFINQKNLNKNLLQIQIIYSGINSSNNFKNYNQNKIIKMLYNNNENIDFIKIIYYLNQNQFWEGLFRSNKIVHKGRINEKQKHNQKYNLKQNTEEINDSEYIDQIQLYQFYGLCFETGNYIQINLSNQGLRQDEQHLLIFNHYQGKKNQKQRIKSQPSVLIVDITLILLKRLLILNWNDTFPKMLNRLFGYQFKLFNIQNLFQFNDFLSYTDRLRQIHQNQLKKQSGCDIFINNDKLNQSIRQKYSLKNEEQINQQRIPSYLQKMITDTEKICDFQLYGYNKTYQNYEKILYSLFSQKQSLHQSSVPLYQFRQMMRNERNVRKVAENYSILVIINKKELPVKIMKLKHFQNHFVVLSINVVEEGLHFVSLGKKCNENLDSTFQNHKNNENIQTPLQPANEQKYRLCLISSSTKTILQCLILQQNESYPLYLPKQQFQMYISAYQQTINQNKTNPSHHYKINKNPNPNNILNFNFYIQSQHIIPKHQYITAQISSQLNQANIMEIKQLQFQLRLKQQYKTYTGMIIQQFIQFSYLKREIESFFKQKILSDNVKIEQTGQLLNLNSQTVDKIQQISQNLQKQQNLETNTQQQLNNHHKTHHNNILTLYQIFNTQSYQFPQQQYQPHNINNNPLLLHILRIHIKSLNLYIDCINTQQYHNINNTSKKTQTKKNSNIILQYQEQKVLCDTAYQKNVVELRENTINLIYLTKDSRIRKITQMVWVDENGMGKNRWDCGSGDRKGQTKFNYGSNVIGLINRNDYNVSNKTNIPSKTKQKQYPFKFKLYKKQW